MATTEISVIIYINDGSDNFLIDNSAQSASTFEELFGGSKSLPSRSGYKLLGFSKNQTNTVADYTVSTTLNDTEFSTAETNVYYCIWQEIHNPVTMLVQDTSLIEIADAIRNKIPLVVTDKTKLLFAGLATTDMFSVGDQITVPWSDGTTTYDFVWDVVHIGEGELEDGTTTSGMYLQSHYLLPFYTPYDDAEPNNEDNDIAAVGSNQWRISNLRQYLNGEGTSWFVKQTDSDVLSVNYLDSKNNLIQGFKSGFESDFIDIIKPIKVDTCCNFTVLYGVTETTYDTFFIPSLEQHYINPVTEYAVDRGDEGEAWDYWKKVTNHTGYSCDDTVEEFITYVIGLPDVSDRILLRSSHRNYSGLVANIDADGSIAYIDCLSESNCTPCCFIPLSAPTTSTTS